MFCSILNGLPAVWNAVLALSSAPSVAMTAVVAFQTRARGLLPAVVPQIQPAQCALIPHMQTVRIFLRKLFVIVPELEL